MQPLCIFPSLLEGSLHMTSHLEPKTIQKLVDVFPSFALLAGMQLDLFTPLKAGPMRPE